MNREQAYELWAPAGGRWSPWVKPVLFAAMDIPPVTPPAEWSASPPDALALPTPGPDEAVVIDLPGVASVHVGAALARRGHRPVPLFNAMPGPAPRLASLAPGPVSPAVVDVWPVVSALQQAAAGLESCALAPDAPPAFLLDAARRGGLARPSPGRFDNRSVSFVTDFPSAHFLLAHGIRRILLVQAGADTPQEDLAHTLLRWQQAGLELTLQRTDQAGPPVPCGIPRPRWYRTAWQRLLAMAGFRRHILGGFGGFVPQPSSG